MEETKSQQYTRQSQQAKRDMLMNWPAWQRRNAGLINDAQRRFTTEGRTDDQHFMDAVEVILDVARLYVPPGKGPHTPLGHDCVVCESMRVVIDRLVDNY